MKQNDTDLRAVFDENQNIENKELVRSALGVLSVIRSKRHILDCTERAAKTLITMQCCPYEVGKMANIAAEYIIHTRGEKEHTFVEQRTYGMLVSKVDMVDGEASWFWEIHGQVEVVIEAGAPQRKTIVYMEARLPIAV